MQVKNLFDTHTHLTLDEPLESIVRGTKWFMEAGGIERIGFLALKAFGRKSFHCLGNSKCLYLKSVFAPYAYAGFSLDWNGKYTADSLAEQVLTAMKSGFDCWKVIEGKPNVQKELNIRLDDGILDKAFALAEREGFPVVVHIADPPAVFESGEYMPADEYRLQLFRVLERHKNLVIVIAHMGFMSDTPERVEKLLNTYPNLYLDNVPAPEEYFAMSAKHEEWKRIHTQYPTRFLFGSDRGSHGAAHFSKEEYLQNFPQTLSYQMRLYTENGPCDGRHPFPGVEELWGTEWYGLGLDGETVLRIFRDNALKLYGEPKPINYECLYAYAKEEFAAQGVSPSQEEDFTLIKAECALHGVEL